MKISAQDIAAGQIIHPVRRMDGSTVNVVCRFLPWKEQLQVAHHYADGPNAGDVGPLMLAVCGLVDLTGCNVTDIHALQNLVTQIVFGFSDPNAERENAPPASLPPPSPAGTINGTTADSSNSAPSAVAMPRRGNGPSKGSPSSTVS